MTILYILVFLIVLGVIIVIHEFGHYFFARKYEVLIHEFSLGMGPGIYIKEKNGIKYSIRALPIGGYVSMSGEGFDELISEGMKVGLTLDQNNSNLVKLINLDESTKADIYGEIISFDFSGEGEKTLYIIIRDENLVETEYIVNENTRYAYRSKEQNRIALKKGSFDNKTKWQRFMIVFAGPLFNFVLAFLLLFIVGIFQGKPQLNSNKIGSSNNSFINSGVVIEEINGNQINTFTEVYQTINNLMLRNVTITFASGDTEEVPVRIVYNNIGITYFNEEVLVGNSDEFGSFKIYEAIGRAQSAGLESGMIIDRIKIDNQNWIIPNNIADFTNYINANLGGKEITVDIDGSLYTYNILPLETIEASGASVIGFDLMINPSRSFDLIYIFTYPFTQMWNDVSDMGKTLGLLFSPTSGVGVGDLAGPVGIFTLVKNATTQGIIPLLIFTAFLSVNIGIINLLPIPALDGGRILFIGYEAITRHKVNKKFENYINMITFILLLLLIFFVTYNDILRL